MSIRYVYAANICEIQPISVLQHSEGDARTAASVTVHVVLNPDLTTELSDENSAIKKPVSDVTLLGRDVPLCRMICCLLPQSMSVQELNVTQS